MADIKTFLQGVRSELAYVQWPSRQEAIIYTIIVIVFSLLVAAYLGALDTVLIKLFGPFLT